MKRQLELLAIKARADISEYCMTECNSYCCRKGTLVLSKEEALIITDNDLEPFINSKRLTRTADKRFSLNLDMTCPQLKKGSCAIHTNPKRPDTCKTFPIFIREDSIHISSRCPALRDNKFYTFLRACKQAGVRIE